MLWLIGLLACETACEGFLCGSGLSLKPRQRRLACISMGMLLAAVTVTLSVLVWRVWLWSLPIAMYRLINILRVYRARLPEQRLRAVAVQTFGWLLAAQIFITLLAWAADSLRFDRGLLDVLVAVQLLGAAVLLRATMHTWRHAVAPGTRRKQLTDRELPSLSVLVPARNETAALDTCLQLLTASEYPKLEILVLDDCSATRQTPAIIKSFARAGVRFVHGEVPDESRWLAKNYAYEQLVHEACGGR